MEDQKMITGHRKKELNKIADFVSVQFSTKNVTRLDLIVESEQINLYIDHYENFFDGMLVFDEGEFHIHLNIDRKNSLETTRGRFSLAHEIAHYYINEHRIGLQNGLLEPHGSITDLNNSDPIELEADYFAGCLLMPYDKLYYFDQVKNFSLDKIKAISESFQVSLLAATIRYCQTCIHEMMFVVSENNIVKWYGRNEYFPKWPFRFKVYGTLPPTTVAGEFFTKPDSRFSSIEEVNPDDWFFPFLNDYRANRKMNEQCFYADNYGYVISLLWFK
ncbi:ImmA/IrrE family metallo-endopeptidase [Sphingobacterium prati]|uniref:ImmA/IrrE family metallo-endopeptidase n=1 Tax=Sphingobacterium prati TaxID=2737006 RepID=UPI001556C03E|nr:ImmA/IrrE family metallo-endopeptidase [Sphingobacterium prati]NPE46263.1 ImmA/IrrE family metallo-endopeptidase [Sphingobacterium prati]